MGFNNIYKNILNKVLEETQLKGSVFLDAGKDTKELVKKQIIPKTVKLSKSIEDGSLKKWVLSSKFIAFMDVVYADGSNRVENIKVQLNPSSVFDFLNITNLKSKYDKELVDKIELNFDVSLSKDTKLTYYPKLSTSFLDYKDKSETFDLIGIEDSEFIDFLEYFDDIFLAEVLENVDDFQTMCI